MRKSKMVAVILALFMAISAAGCGSTDKQGSGSDTSAQRQSTQSQSGEPQSTQPESAEAQADLTPVTLKVTAMCTNLGAHTGIMTDPVSSYIKEKTGISIELTAVQDGGDYDTKLAAMVASNDLPDVFPGGKESEMIQAGVIIPLDDLVDKHAPNLKADKYAQVMMLMRKNNNKVDGKLYTLGMCMGTWDSGTGSLLGNYIRWDLYKQLGYPKLESYDDDLLNVLIEMQKLEPVNKDGKKTYVMGSYTPAGVQGNFMGAYTIGFTEGINNASLGYMLEAPIDTYLPYDQSPLKNKGSTIWRGLKFLNKAFQAGVLDPDSYTQTYDNYQQKLNEGRYMITQLSWLANAMNVKFKEQGMPEKGYVALPPLNNTERYSLYSGYLWGERTFHVAKTCKYPERAVQLLDFMSTYEFSRIANNGLEGTNWNMVNGRPVPTDEYLAAQKTDKEFQLKTGAGIYDHMCGFASGTIDPATNQTIDLYASSPEAQSKKESPATKDFVAHYGAESLAEVYSSRVKYSVNYDLTSVLQLSDDKKPLKANMDAYLEKAYTKCLVAKTDAEFAKAQDELIKGLDDYEYDEFFKMYYDYAMQEKDNIVTYMNMLE